MITFLFPRGSIPNLFTADVRLCSAGYRKVFECGNGPCWSRSQRIQISTITTHARGPSQGPFGIWPILSLDGGTVWGSGLSSLEEHLAFACQIVSTKQQKLLILHSFLWCQESGRISHPGFATCARQSLHVIRRRVWGLTGRICGDFTHKNRDWFEALNGYGWKLIDKDQQHDQNLRVLC